MKKLCLRQMLHLELLHFFEHPLQAVLDLSLGYIGCSLGACTTNKKTKKNGQLAQKLFGSCFQRTVDVIRVNVVL